MSVTNEIQNDKINEYIIKFLYIKILNEILIKFLYIKILNEIILKKII